MLQCIFGLEFENIKMLVEIGIGLATIAVLFYVYMTWKFDYWEKRGIPYIKGKFPSGSMPPMWGKRRHLNDVFEEHGKKMKDQKMYGIFFFRSPILIVQDVELLKNILVKDFDYFVDRNPANVLSAFKKTGTRSDEIWSKQMSSASGDEWKDIRATFSPIFTSGIKATLDGFGHGLSFNFLQAK